MADILARVIFFVLNIVWIILVMVPLWFLCAITSVLCALTSWRVFYRMAATAEKLTLKAYLLMRYIAMTWLTEEEISEIESELDIFHKDS